MIKGCEDGVRCARDDASGLTEEARRRLGRGHRGSLGSRPRVSVSSLSSRSSCRYEAFEDEGGAAELEAPVRPDAA